MTAPQKPIIVFGLGTFASLITRYIKCFTNWDISCYTADDDFCAQSSFEERDVIPWTRLIRTHSPEKFDALLAIGYTNYGRVREKAFLQLKQQGFHVMNFIHPTASVFADSLGEGNIILEDAILGMDSIIGDANLFWNGCNLSHECIVGSFNTFCPSSTFAGFSVISDHCVFGVNCTCINNLRISDSTFVGAGALLTRNTEINDCIVRHGDMPSRNRESIDRFLGI